MRLLLLFLCFFSASVRGEDEKIALVQQPPVEEAVQKEEFPLTDFFQITPRVSVTSGEYCEENSDFIIAGSEPISLTRFYGHFSFSHNHLNWRFNPETFCVANFNWENQKQFVAVGEKNGNITNYSKKSNNHFVVSPHTLKSSCFYPGANHPVNTKISYRKNGTEFDFSWNGTIEQGDGTKKIFRTYPFQWHSQQRKVKHRDPESRTVEFDITEPDTWIPYQIPIVEEHKPNGNIIEYKYYHKGSSDRPGHYLLKSITVYNGKKTKILGWLKFSECINGRIEVTGSDNRKACFNFSNRFLSDVTSPDSPRVRYEIDSEHRITSVNKPEGRSFKTFYGENNKVFKQQAPVGENGEMQAIAIYDFRDNVTIIHDALGNKSAYRYDAHKRITSYEIFDHEKAWRIERYHWDENSGNLSSKTISDKSNTIFLEEKYKYDKHQNIIEESIGDGHESYKIYRTYSKDGLNLKLSERDDFGKFIKYNYVKGTNLLSSQFIYSNKKIIKRFFYFYDDCAQCIKSICDDGTSENPQDIDHVSYRKIQCIKPRYECPCFGLPEVVEEKTIDANGKEILLSKIKYSYAPSGKILKEDHYDSNDCLCYSIKNSYDNKERLVSTTNALNETTLFSYDANNNLISYQGPRKDLHKEWKYDKANRPISENFGDLTTLKKYDKLGRVVALVDECGFETKFKYDIMGNRVAISYPDGSIEKKEYDILGRVTKEIDCNGFATIKKYNFRGDPISIAYPDGSKETFVYRLDGKLISNIDKNGAQRNYTYDDLGNLLKEEIVDSKGTLLKSQQSTYSPFFKTTATNPEGVITTFKYDYSGKKIEECINGISTYFSFDALGRLIKTEIGEIVQVSEYDLLNRVVEKRVETLSSEILQNESYEYDVLGNKCRVNNGYGTTITTFDHKSQPLKIKDPLGNVTIFSYEYLGGLKKRVINPKGIITTQVYDSRKREKESYKTDGQGNVIQKMAKKYDGNGNIIETKEYIFDDATIIRISTNTFSYGSLNRLESKLEEKQKQTLYIYDKQGKLQNLVKPDGTVLQSSYDVLGRLQRFSSSDFDYNYIYDKCDNVIEVTDNVSNTITTRSYNAFGNLLEEKLANGLNIKNHYDSRGRRDKMILPDQSEIDFSYKNEQFYNISRNHQSVTYIERDLAGQVTEALLSQNLGKIKVSRDKLGRIKTFSSPYYNANFPSDAYDGNGNLSHFEFEDALGKEEIRFTYDPLDQLTSDSEHHYHYDSMRNRLKKDDHTHQLNEFSQISDDGYVYDKNGNMISNGTCQFKYDSQDRLIEVIKNGITTYYSYDPFHRRLSKTFETQTENYIYDEQNDIGTIINQKIVHLRVLGEGLGAEIGAAALYELNGILFFPIHDVQGSLVTLISCETGEVGETYRYTPFGEELTGNTLSPWLFSSKRYDKETTFIYFGRRYYNPTLGRWITPDPQGFQDGPNLYAYVQNSPLTRIDLYGLEGILNGLFDRIWDYLSNYNQERMSSQFRDYCTGDINCTLHTGNGWQGFGNKWYTETFGKIPTGNIHIEYGNGVYCSPRDIKESGLYVSHVLGDAQVEISANPTNGLIKDPFHAVASIVGNVVTEVTVATSKRWCEYIDKNPNDFILRFSHSHGCAITEVALKHTPKNVRDRIIVLAIAPAKYIDEGLCLESHHLVSKSDLVPWIDFRGRMRNEGRITVLEPHPDAGFFDHSFQSETYKQSIIDYYAQIKHKYCNE